MVSNALLEHWSVHQKLNLVSSVTSLCARLYKARIVTPGKPIK